MVVAAVAARQKVSDLKKTKQKKQLNNLRSMVAVAVAARQKAPDFSLQSS